MPEPAPLDRQRPLYGRHLRHAALYILDTHGAASITEILDVLWANDYRLTGDRTTTRKRLSDALRHETKQGRARRVGWGVYAIDHLTKTTRWCIHQRWNNAAPATKDHEGEPILQPRHWSEPEPIIPWTKHDRHGDPIFLYGGRHRWKIGRRVHAVLGRRCRTARLAAQAANDHHSRSPRPRRWPPLTPPPTTRTATSANRTRIRIRTLTTHRHRHHDDLAPGGGAQAVPDGGGPKALASRASRVVAWDR